MRIDAVGHAEKFFRVGDIAHVGRFLAGEDRKVRQPQDLRALDLGVPVGALDETDHDPSVEPFRQRMKPVDDGAGAASVGLHDDAEPVPARKLGVGQHRLDHLQRQRQPVGFLGVDVEAHLRARRLPGEVAGDGDEFGHHAGFLRHLVARV